MSTYLTETSRKTLWSAISTSLAHYEINDESSAALLPFEMVYNNEPLKGHFSVHVERQNDHLSIGVKSMLDYPHGSNPDKDRSVRMEMHNALKILLEKGFDKLYVLDKGGSALDALPASPDVAVIYRRTTEGGLPLNKNYIMIHSSKTSKLLAGSIILNERETEGARTTLEELASTIYKKRWAQAGHNSGGPAR